MIQIQVVGSGCPSCQRLAALCREIVAETGIEAQIEKVTEFQRFADLGVMITPGLLVNGRLLSSGKIPMKETLARWIEDAAGEVPA